MDTAITAPVWAPRLYPPVSWFDAPTAEMRAQVPDTSDSPIIEFDGQVWGRLAAANAAYLNVVGQVIKPDMDPRAYGPAMSKTKRLESGDRIECSVISFATGHAPAGLSDPDAIKSWYEGGGPQQQAADDCTSAMFHVRYHILDDGIWFTGATAPHRSEFDAIVAASSAPSGDWIRLNGQPFRTLLGACMVASQGFRASITDARVNASVSFEVNDRVITYGRAERISAGVGVLVLEGADLSRLAASLTGERYVSWGDGLTTSFGAVAQVAVKSTDKVRGSNGDELAGDPMDPAVAVTVFAPDSMGMYQSTAERVLMRGSAVRPWDDANWMRTMSAVGDISISSDETIVTAQIIVDGPRTDDEVTFDLDGTTVTGIYITDLGYPGTLGPIAYVDVNGTWYYVPIADLTRTGGHLERVDLDAGELTDLAVAGRLTVRDMNSPGVMDMGEDSIAASADASAMSWAYLKAAKLI